MARKWGQTTVSDPWKWWSVSYFSIRGNGGLSPISCGNGGLSPISTYFSLFFPIQEQDVKVEVEVEGRSEGLDQRYRAGCAFLE